MNTKKFEKYESEARLNELCPAVTLKRAGLTTDMTICDIGAGTGAFAFPAAEITEDMVYALEISDDMLEILESRKKERGIDNLVIKKVQGTQLPLEDSSCDMVIMVTVLHELEETETILNEIRRILKPDGKLMIVEFHKRGTPMGPSISHRISVEETEDLCHRSGYITTDQFCLGENFYSIIFQK